MNSKRRILAFILSLWLTGLASSSVTDSLKQELRNQPPAKKGHTYLALSGQYLDSLQLGLAYADSAMALGTALKNDTLIANAIRMKGNAFLVNRIYQKADSLLKKALSISLKGNLERTKAKTYYSLGYLGLSQNNYKEALPYFLSALPYYEARKDSQSIVDINFNISLIYQSLGLYDRAIETGDKALKLYIAQKDTFGIASMYNNMAIIYHNWGNLDQARSYYELSLKLSREIGDSSGIATAQNNLGEIEKDRGNYQAALSFYRKSLETARAAGLANLEAVAQLGISETYLKLGMLQKSMDYANKALASFQKLNDREWIAQALSVKGEIQLKLGKMRQAVNSFKKSAGLAVELGLLDLQKTSYKGLSDAFYRLRQFEKSLNYYKLYSAARDSLFNRKNAEMLTRMQVLHETEKIQRQIEILKRENQIQQLKIQQANSFRRYTIIIGFLVLLLIGLFTARYQTNKKHARQLETKNQELTKLNTELQKALQEVKQLSGLLPICANCKKIRDDKGYWNQIEDYISTHSDADFSHGICPECASKLYPDYADSFKKENPDKS